MDILIICGGGFSSSFLVQNIKKAAAEKGLSVNVLAKAEGALAGSVSNFDIVLVSPQLRYNDQKIIEICNKAGVPYAFVTAMDFGTMNGEAVLQLAIDTLGEEEDA